MKKVIPSFIRVDGWVGVWEKRAKFIDVYPASAATRHGIADEMISALREGRNHPESVDGINVSQDLNRRGSPKNYLNDTDFVKATLREWADEFGHLHRPVQTEAVAA